ncbi:hypothetical protein ACFVH6_13785 [Spirillospora sp. NPDC127200]
MRAGAEPPIPEAERGVVTARLNRACGTGALSLGDYARRVDEAQVVRRRAEPEVLLDGGAPVAGAGNDVGWHVALFGGPRRRGHWSMRRHLVSLVPVGGITVRTGG